MCNGMNHGERDLMPQEEEIHITHLPILSGLQDPRDAWIIYERKVAGERIFEKIITDRYQDLSHELIPLHTGLDTAF